MKIYFILTAVLILCSLLIPLSVNEICESPTEFEETPQINSEDNYREKIKLIRTTSDKIIEIDMYDYITGTVAGEMPASFNAEALKAQAIASYTYAKYIIENSNKKSIILSDSPYIHQSYIDEAEQREKWGEYYDEYKNKIENAVNEVYGQYLTFNEKTAMTVFHALSTNKTNSAEEIWGQSVSYLVSVNSPCEKSSEEEFTFTEDEFKKIFQEKGGILLNEGDSRKWAKIIEKTEEGYIRKLMIENKNFTSIEISSILSLPSSNFTARYEKEAFIFTAYGKGHGVGMSQYSAEHMANNGKNYKEILTHFYPGTELIKE